ncbi:MAG: phosphotransferase [Acidimicrobiales bacterium]
MNPSTPHGMAVNKLAQVRVAQVLRAAKLPTDTPLERMCSVTNEVWRTSQYLIRVNRRADGRLRREAFLSRGLPDEVEYPEIMAISQAPEMDWMITRRVPGTPLSRAWPTMTTKAREGAIEQLAQKLKSLHATPFTDNIAPLDTPPQLLDLGSPTPTWRLLDSIKRAGQLKFVEAELIEAISQHVRDYQSSIDGVPVTNFVHGDLTFENLLWDGTKISAMIDFEWSRPGPADLDLDILLRLAAFPFLHVAPDYEAQTLASDYELIPSVLERHYPELWDAECIVERLALYSIAYDIRALLRFPPKDHPSRLYEHHPLNRLRRTVALTSHVHQFLQAGFAL